MKDSRSIPAPFPHKNKLKSDYGAWMGIHCSLALISALRSLGVEIGAGLHTGEVEVGSEDVRGIAAHIAARWQHRLSRANAWSLER
jgi:class 3 adenylate cyclase